MSDDLRPARRHLGAAGSGALSCARVAHLLPALAGDDGGVSRRARAHVARCLRCQAEVARDRRLRRNLAGLRAQPIDPGPVLVGEILAGIDLAWAEHPRGSRVVRGLACVGGISVATVAGAGMLVWMSRRRLAEAS